MESNFKITATHHYPEIFSEELVKFLIHLLKKFNQARITNLPEITIAEKQEVSEDNVPSGPQKEGSFF